MGPVSLSSVSLFQLCFIPQLLFFLSCAGGHLLTANLSASNSELEIKLLQLKRGPDFYYELDRRYSPQNPEHGVLWADLEFRNNGSRDIVIKISRGFLEPPFQAAAAPGAFRRNIPRVVRFCCGFTGIVKHDLKSGVGIRADEDIRIPPGKKLKRKLLYLFPRKKYPERLIFPYIAGDGNPAKLTLNISNL